MVTTLEKDKVQDSVQTEQRQNVFAWLNAPSAKEITEVSSYYEAIKKAGLHGKLTKQSLQTSEGKIAEGVYGIHDDKLDKIVGVVKGRYVPISNEQAFSLIEPLFNEKKVEFVAGGHLYEGKRSWLLAKLTKPFYVENRNKQKDELQSHILCYTSHDGSLPTIAKMINARVVCSNLISSNMKNTSNMIRVIHSSRSIGQIAAGQLIFNTAVTNMETFMEAAAKLVAKECNAQYVGSFTAKISKMLSSQEEKQKEIKDELTRLYEKGKGNCGQSRWDLLNAVTEFIDHSDLIQRRSFKNNKAGDLALASTFFGRANKIKDEALNILLS